jgi:hypothetical protein
MPTIHFRPPLAVAAGILLTLPLLLFFMISILKFELNNPYLYDIAFPLLDKAGIRQPPGLNINLLFLGGPIVALLLNVASILKISARAHSQQLLFRITIYKNWWNLFVVLFSGAALMLLLLYLAAENCHCS